MLLWLDENAEERAGRARLFEEVAKAEVLALLGVRQGDDAARGRVEVPSRRARGPGVPFLSRARPSMARGRSRPATFGSHRSVAARPRDSERGDEAGARWGVRCGRRALERDQPGAGSADQAAP